MTLQHIKTTLFLGIVLLSITSCKKFLEETPNNALPTETAITDAGTARAAIIGAYDRSIRLTA